jgi:hypothetical protein
VTGRSDEIHPHQHLSAARSFHIAYFQGCGMRRKGGFALDKTQGESDCIYRSWRSVRLCSFGGGLTVFGSFYPCFGSLKIEYWNCDKPMFFVKGGFMDGRELMPAPEPLQTAQRNWA